MDRSTSSIDAGMQGYYALVATTIDEYSAARNPSTDPKESLVTFYCRRRNLITRTPRRGLPDGSSASVSASAGVDEVIRQVRKSFPVDPASVASPEAWTRKVAEMVSSLNEFLVPGQGGLIFGQLVALGRMRPDEPDAFRFNIAITLKYTVEIATTPRTLTKSKRKDEIGEEENCAICLSLCRGGEGEAEESAVELPCLHFFHQRCFYAWLVNQRKQSKSVSCPLCRSVVSPPPPSSLI